MGPITLRSDDRNILEQVWDGKIKYFIPKIFLKKSFLSESFVTRLAVPGVFVYVLGLEFDQKTRCISWT